MNDIEKINMEYRNKKVAFIKYIQDLRQNNKNVLALKVLNNELNAVKILKM